MRRFFHQKNKFIVQREERRRTEFIPLNTLNAKHFPCACTSFSFYQRENKGRQKKRAVAKECRSDFDYAHLSNSHLYTPELLWHHQAHISRDCTRKNTHERASEAYRYGAHLTFATSGKDGDKFTCLCSGKREVDTHTHTRNLASSSTNVTTTTTKNRLKLDVNCEEHKRRTSSAQVYVNRYTEQTNQKTE